MEERSEANCYIFKDATGITKRYSRGVDGAKRSQTARLILKYGGAVLRKFSFKGEDKIYNAG